MIVLKDFCNNYIISELINNVIDKDSLRIISDLRWDPVIASVVTITTVITTFTTVTAVITVTILTTVTTALGTHQG